ncbi:acyltransferase [Listeria sp. FSL L7-0091]|uniref:Acyltransferase n=1 Tax=Listeria farberi TaxID=2713500 RepID=A0A7X0ZJN3_9LIST|nr:acyltransferase [Listeria farberi]MBC1376530.1 acyltransferase [Listeria farberi]MBC1382477.1 acyltransferase [Listeria farberi]MBC2261332.1 acyltransferase [Listeria farberi]MBC2268665.1 acyltransferase [Listeria farberi]MBC2288547.1 acyltransferase [Listeria farberi]
MRRLNRFKAPDEEVNTLFQVYKTISFWKVVKNTVVVEFGRFFPWMSGKRNIYRTCLGMKIGKKTAIAYKVMPDLFFPEKITIGENSIIGYHTTILTHEYLLSEYRVGEVVIGKDVMVGANVTILPGIEIGDGAIIAAGAVVSKDIPPESFAYGNPLVIKEKATFE